MPIIMMQIIMRSFYIIGISSDPYTQQHIKFQGKIMKFKYQSKRLLIKTNATAILWDFWIITESEIMYRMSRGGQMPYLEK